MTCSCPLARWQIAVHVHARTCVPTYTRHTLRKVGVDQIFSFGRTCVYDILRDLGYAYCESGDDRGRLRQQEHVCEHRREYLKRIAELRAMGYLLWYLDETWVNKNSTDSKTWTLTPDGSTVAPATAAANAHARAAAATAPHVLRPHARKKPIGKGGCAIVIGIGSRVTGVVPELLEIFRGKQAGTGQDYHKEMNAKVFEEWLKKALKWITEAYACLCLPQRTLLRFEHVFTLHSTVCVCVGVLAYSTHSHAWFMPCARYVISYVHSFPRRVFTTHTHSHSHTHTHTHTLIQVPQSQARNRDGQRQLPFVSYGRDQGANFIMQQRPDR